MEFNKKIFKIMKCFFYIIFEYLFGYFCKKFITSYYSYLFALLKNAKNLKKKLKLKFFLISKKAKNVKNSGKKLQKKFKKFFFFNIWKAEIRWSKILRILIRIRIGDTPNFAYQYLAYPYFLKHCLYMCFCCYR